MFLMKDLKAGDYYVSLKNYSDTPDYYGFTVENDIDMNNLIRISEGKVYVYASDRNQIIYTTDVTVTSKNESDMTGQKLLSLNYKIHCDIGNLNYQESDVREWLNSDKTDWWKAQNEYSLMPKDYLSVPGFVNGIDEDFLNAVNPVVKVTVLPDGTTVETQDKFFLVSAEEIYAEGTNHYPYFENNASLPEPDYAADAIRIKNFLDSPRHWWLRNAAQGDNGYMRSLTDGSVGPVNYAKIHAFGVVPTCTIC